MYSNDAGTVSYAYDSYSRISSRNDGAGNTVIYGYDAYGFLSSITAKHGETVVSATGYCYDKYGRLISVTDTNGRETTYSYDSADRVSLVQTIDGSVTTYAYDTCGRVTSETVTAADGTELLKYSYTYGKCGELNNATEQSADGKNVVTSYTYDTLLRLTQEQTTDSVGTLTIDYAYDAVSNRTSRTVTIEGDVSGFVNADENVHGGTTTYTYNALDQLETETTPDGTNTYAYDKNGNLTSISGAKAVQYSYDEFGRLKAVSATMNGITSQEKYTYDAEGNRISRTNDTETVYYVNDTCADLTQVIAELNNNGSLKKEYTRGLAVISATNGKAEAYCFVSDGLGNIRAITANGVITDQYRYDAYGNLIEKIGDTDNDLLYNGEQYSEACGLYYLRARYMDPTTGRFISMDAYAGELVDPTSMHKYLYANANPVMYSDPSGYSNMSEQLTSTAIASALIGGLSGALLGALHADADPECQGWDRVWRTLICAGSGALTGIFFAYCPYLIGPASLYGMISCRLEAIEAKKNGNTELAIVNNLMAGLSAISVGTYAGYMLPRLLEPLGTIPVNSGTLDLDAFYRTMEDNPEPFLPEEYYRNLNKRSQFGYQEPNTREVYTRYGNTSHEIETSIIISDEYGRIKFRIDYSTHGRNESHTNPHIHEFSVDTNKGNYNITEIKYFLDKETGRMRLGRANGNGTYRWFEK